ncbi:monoglyceride lipase-like [Amblyomma americanum]
MWFRAAVFRPAGQQLHRLLSTAGCLRGRTKMSWPDVPLEIASRDGFDIERGSFTNADNLQIVTKAWVPQVPQSVWKALVFMCHGYVEHCHVPFYDILARSLVGEGCYVFAQDLVGHGESAGQRANVKTFDKYLVDILQHVDSTKEKFPGKPVYLFGHSMGGLLVAMAVQRRPADFAGLVMMSPFFAPNKEVAPTHKRVVTKMLGRVLPSAPIGALDVSLISRDPAVVAYMVNDPLRHQADVPLGWASASLRAADNFRANIHLIKVPIFLQIAGDDKICDIDAMKEFFAAVPSTEKKIQLYKGAYHNLLTEPEGIREQGFKDIAEWFNDRLSSARPVTPPPESGKGDVAGPSGRS